MIILPVLLAIAAQAGGDEDTLTPAREGLLRCTSPDPARKTCSSLTSFTIRPDGSFEAEVTGIGGPAGIQVHYRMPGKIVGGAACFVHRTDTLASATFTKPNARLAQSLQETLRRDLAAAMAPLNGRQRCYRDQIDNAVLIARTTLDGVAQPDLDRPVRWVAPGDGYKVE
ncbi:MAG: hypothetical protein J7500_10490 [Sphingomonas sp.]|uniref:hypothetical protein n=1 Tax=Sphingomonas sp. TaxID=28214 RepID=UPI001B0E70A6|nr:hypothetical protein [Sphingomonas sp.]MBO9623127.1 hypothetical protein [Sphingomonas sp.]